MCAGTAHARPMTENTGQLDVLVVGGGAAGLSAGVTLSRARRRVLVVDQGNPRNAPAGHVHNYLGNEGVPPLELLRARPRRAGVVRRLRASPARRRRPRCRGATSPRPSTTGRPCAPAGWS